MHNKESQGSVAEGASTLLFVGSNERQSPHQSSTGKNCRRAAVRVSRCCQDQSQGSQRWTCCASRVSFLQLVQLQQYNWWRKEVGEVATLTWTSLCCRTIGMWWHWTVSGCGCEAEKERGCGLRVLSLSLMWLDFFPHHYFKHCITSVAAAPFYIWRNWGSQRLNILPSVTQLEPGPHSCLSFFGFLLPSVFSWERMTILTSGVFFFLRPPRFTPSFGPCSPEES